MESQRNVAYIKNIKKAGINTWMVSISESRLTKNVKLQYAIGKLQVALKQQRFCGAGQNAKQTESVQFISASS